MPITPPAGQEVIGRILAGGASVCARCYFPGGGRLLLTARSRFTAWSPHLGSTRPSSARSRRPRRRRADPRQTAKCGRASLPWKKKGARCRRLRPDDRHHHPPARARPRRTGTACTPSPDVTASPPRHLLSCAAARWPGGAQVSASALPLIPGCHPFARDGIGPCHRPQPGYSCGDAVRRKPVWETWQQPDGLYSDERRAAGGVRTGGGRQCAGDLPSGGSGEAAAQIGRMAVDRPSQRDRSTLALPGPRAGWTGLARPIPTGREARNAAAWGKCVAA